MLVGFPSYRQIPEIPPFDFYVEQRLLVDWITDKVGGLFVAFDPTDENSYYTSHGALAYAPFLALTTVVSSPKSALSRVERAMRTPAYAAGTGAVLLGLALLLQVHVAHEKFY